MISEIAENEFETVNFKFHEEIGDMGGLQVVALETRPPNFVVDILNRKIQISSFSNREIKPMMAGCTRMELEVSFIDKEGNKVTIKATGEKEVEKSNDNASQNETQKADSPDSTDRDFNRDE